MLQDFLIKLVILYSSSWNELDLLEKSFIEHFLKRMNLYLQITSSLQAEVEPQNKHSKKSDW